MKAVITEKEIRQLAERMEASADFYDNNGATYSADAYRTCAEMVRSLMSEHGL